MPASSDLGLGRAFLLPDSTLREDAHGYPSPSSMQDRNIRRVVEATEPARQQSLIAWTQVLLLQGVDTSAATARHGHKCCYCKAWGHKCCYCKAWTQVLLLQGVDTSAATARRGHKCCYCKALEIARDYCTVKLKVRTNITTKQCFTIESSTTLHEVE